MYEKIIITKVKDGWVFDHEQDQKVFCDTLEQALDLVKQLFGDKHND